MTEQTIGAFLRVLSEPADSPRLKEIYRQADECIRRGRKPPIEIWYAYGKHNHKWLSKRCQDHIWIPDVAGHSSAAWAVALQDTFTKGFQAAIVLGLDLLCVYSIRPRLFWRLMAEGQPLRFGLRKVGKWQDGGGMCEPYPKAVYCRDANVADILMDEATRSKLGKPISECLSAACERLGITPFDEGLDLPIVRHSSSVKEPDPAIFHEQRIGYRSYRIGLRGPAKQRIPKQSWIDARLSKATVGNMIARTNTHKHSIGFLTPTLQLGGAERWLSSLASGLDRSRFAVVAVATETYRPPFEPYVERITNRCPILEGVQSWSHIADNVDAIVAWGIRSLEPVSGFRGPIVYVSQGPSYYTDYCVNGCLPKITHRVAVSQSAASAFPDPDSVSIIPNGVCEDAMKERQSRDDMRRAWGARQNEILVGYVGRFSPEKKPVEVADVVARLGKSYRLVYVGNGHCEEEMLAETRKICPNLIHQPAIENVGDCYRALDWLVLLSDSEGFSNVLTEAWYCGTPTVCKAVGALPSLECEHGQLAKYVPLKVSAEHVAEVIRAGADSAIVRRAKQVASEHYTDAAMCQRWGEYLDGILTGKQKDGYDRLLCSGVVG